MSEDQNATTGNDDEKKVTSENVRQMKAVTLTGFGGIRMVKVQQRPESKPGPGEILIRVRAGGINFSDLMVRQGVIENPPKTPFIMGFECSGEVESLGEGVNGFSIGDRVIGISDYKCWAESVCCGESFVYKIPTGMSFEDAAAIFFNYVTAYILLFDIANLRPHQSVLVHSAGGGVGVAVSQLCRTVEGVVLFGTASNCKHESIKNMYDHLLDHSVDYVQEVRKISPEGVDIVLDSLCGEDTNKGISLLKPLGKYVLYGSSNIVTGETKSFFSFAKSWWQMDKISPIRLHDENKTTSGFNLRHFLFKQSGAERVKVVLEKIFNLYNKGKIKPIIDSVWAYEDITEAMQKMHDRKNVGKLLLDPKMESKNKNEKVPESPKNNETPK
ncbi:hypothetical protein HELRODRAFT_109239 [Helobdella robusta]|uniref:Enoyl reductase (ER) domain-containing protein n=1 Tax=Helobdella robusta TaxID=6412 RepID=T1EER8_HELRO|nr:hypothetical protein HELRODRAFT_109239 [Helobdella robusta]ESO10962.1 hypothetical protein HELRODRAFT_109239 [Helobdella robusta]